jgi:hypothetical protein
LTFFSSYLQPAATLDHFAAYRDSPPEQAFELHEYPTADSSNPVRAPETKRERKRREKLEQLREAEEMKFSHSLQFNAVPDWSNHYVAYSNLKKQYVPHVMERRCALMQDGEADQRCAM